MINKEIENRIDEITNDFGNRITEIFSLKFSNSRLVVCPQRYEIRVGMSNGRTEPVGPKSGYGNIRHNCNFGLLFPKVNGKTKLKITYFGCEFLLPMTDTTSQEDVDKFTLVHILSDLISDKKIVKQIIEAYDDFENAVIPLENTLLCEQFNYFSKR